MLKKSVWAVVDQSLFAGTNLVLGIFLASLLSIQDYGLFSILFSILLLWGVVQNALLIEPFLVFAAKDYATHLASYYVLLLKCTLLISAVAGMLTLSFTYYFFDSQALAACFSLTLCMPLVYGLWLSRRVPCITGRMENAVQGGSLYCFVLFLGLGVLYLFDLVSVANAFYLLGVGSLLTTVWFCYAQREVVGKSSLNFQPMKLVVQHWEQGRWHLLSGLIVWATINLYIFTLPINGGLEDSALFRILTIMSFPVLHAVNAVAMVMIPHFSKIEKSTLFVTVIIKWMVILNILAIAYYIVLILYGEHVVEWLFGSQYLAYGYSPYLLIGVLVGAPSMAVLSAALKVLKQTKDIFKAYVVGGVCTVTVGFFGALNWGINGAVLGWSGASILTALFLGFKLKKTLNKCLILA